MEKTAALLGKNDDSIAFGQQAELERNAFNTRFFDPVQHRYDTGSQTAQAMPLVLGLVPENLREAVLENLIRDIRAHGDHVTAGDIGFHYVVQALSEGGRSDVIYDLLANPEAPSYASQLARGATSLTEAWDASPRSSQNHFMLGHAEEWFYRYLAGIDLDLSRPADEQIVLRPTPVGDVASAEAKVHTVLGSIVSRWKLADGHLQYDVEIPPNTKAKVVLPSGVQEIGSGSHRFDVPYPEHR